MASIRRLSRSGRSEPLPNNAPMGPKEPASTVLIKEEEAMCVAFRQQTLLPFDDSLYALQPTIPHLSRSSLHRGYQRYGISRLPDSEGDNPAKKTCKKYPIGYVHLDIADVRPKKANSICSSPSTEPAPSPLRSCTRLPTEQVPRRACAVSSASFRTRSIRA